MFSNILTSLVALALAQSAFAGVYITSPVGTTNAIGGQVLSVKWADNGQSPSVAEIGPSSIDLYTGSVNQQTFLQNLAASVDVSKTSEISTTIDPSVGQTGPYYFVRFRSLNLKDGTNPQYNYQAYSAKFEIDSMTGKFNATVLAQIDASNTTTTASVVSSAGLTKQSASASASKSGVSTTPSAARASGGASSTIALSSGFVLIAGIASYLVI